MLKLNASKPFNVIIYFWFNCASSLTLPTGRQAPPGQTPAQNRGTGSPESGGELNAADPSGLAAVGRAAQTPLLIQEG